MFDEGCKCSRLIRLDAVRETVEKQTHVNAAIRSLEKQPDHRVRGNARVDCIVLDVDRSGRPLDEVDASKARLNRVVENARNVGPNRWCKKCRGKDQCQHEAGSAMF